MGTHLSALTSCASRRTASINLNKLPSFKKEYSSAEWTSATHSTRRLVSSHYESDASFYASRHAMETDAGRARQSHLRRHLSSGCVDGSTLTVDESVGREKSSSTNTSASTSLQRDFDGEGYKEEVDSIIDLIDLMHRDFLLLPTTTEGSDVTTTTTRCGLDQPRIETATMETTTTTTTTTPTKRQFSREMSRTSVKTQSGKWDSSVDDVIADIFDKIYSSKRVV